MCKHLHFWLSVTCFINSNQVWLCRTEKSKYSISDLRKLQNYIFLMLKRPEESLGLGWPDHRVPRLLLCHCLLSPACDFKLLVHHPYLVNRKVEDVKKGWMCSHPLNFL